MDTGQKIKLASVYARKVKTGEKTQTIRLGRKKYERGHAHFETAVELIPIKIIDVDYVPYKGLDVLDAKRDGFDSLEQLQDALKKHYPNIQDSDYVTVISFEYNRYG